MVLPQLITQELLPVIQISAIERMAMFIILMYGQYFLQTAMTAAAHAIDLGFWRNAVQYEVINKDIFKIVVESIHRQMFYITEKLCVLTLCDNITSNEEKEKALIEIY